MSSPKAHHFVPRFYLARWTDSDGRLVVYARKNNRLVVDRLNPKSTGFEPGLYSISGVDEDKRQLIETQFFSEQIDNPAAQIIQELVEQRVGRLTLEQHVLFACFLMSLRARHPGAIEMAREQGASLLRSHLGRNPEEYEALRAEGDPSTLNEWADHHIPVRVQNFGLDVVQKVITHPEVSRRLSESRWSVVGFTSADGRHRLLTSDRPCILKGNLVDGSFLIVLPLSPNHVFLACNDPRSEEYLRHLPPDGLVTAINQEVVSSAAKYVYGTDDGQVQFVDELLKREAI